MAFATGQGAYFAFDDPSGSLYNWSSYLTNVDHEFTVDTPESTTFGQNHVARTTGLKDKSISVSGIFDATLDRNSALKVGQVGTFRFGPNGSDSGDLRYTGEALCTELSLSEPHDGLITFSASFETDDTVTNDTF